jgi:O-antigen/teichoic acid export membrane protein
MSGVSLGKMTIQLLGARGIRFASSLLSSIIVARSLGVEGLGAYAYALGVAALFAMVPNMGVSTVVTRRIAQESEEGDAIIRSAFVAQVLLAFGVTGLIMGFAALMPSQQVPLAYVFIAAMQLALNSLSWPYLAILGGHSRFDRVASAELLSSVVTLPLLVIVAIFFNSVAGFLLIKIVGSLLSLYIARRAAKPWLPKRGRRYSLRRLFRESIPFGAVGSITGLYGSFDLILLGQMASVAAVGLYNAAFKPVTVTLYVGMTVAGIIFPIMSKVGHGEVPHAFARLMRAVGILGPAMALAVGGLSYWVLVLMFGEEYGGASFTLTILIWSVAARWVYAPLGHALQAQGVVRWWLVAVVCATLINLAINWWAIPRWWADGAAVARLTSDIFLLVVAALLVHHRLAIRIPVLAVAKIGVAMVAAAMVLLELMAWDRLAATAAALALYFGLLMLFRMVSLSDIGTVTGWVRDALGGRGRE